jgi:flagellar protein FlaG
VDTFNTPKGIQSKLVINLTGGNAAPSKAPAPVPMPRTDAVASNFSEINNNNKKSVDTLMNNRKEIDNALAELTRLADNSGRTLGFSRDPAISGPVITVTDSQTGKVVRQIPFEVVVRVAHSIEKMKGLLFDKSF